MNNPIEIVKQFAQKNNNPMIRNLIDMAQNKNNVSVEQFARNMFKEQGRDFDKEFSAFMKQFNNR